MHDNEIEQLRQEDLAREARDKYRALVRRFLGLVLSKRQDIARSLGVMEVGGGIAVSDLEQSMAWIRAIQDRGLINDFRECLNKADGITREKTTMPELIPPRREQAATYWLQLRGRDPRPFAWNPEGVWEVDDFRVVDPACMAELGYTFATIDGAECRHPIPGPAALLRMHAPDGKMVNVVLSGLSLGVRIEDIITDMLKEAMK